LPQYAQNSIKWGASSERFIPAGMMNWRSIDRRNFWHALIFEAMMAVARIVRGRSVDGLLEKNSARAIMTAVAQRKKR
jgi:hypothetical protein